MAVTQPNDSWSIDFKGQFRTGDGRYASGQLGLRSDCAQVADSSRPPQ
jgi:hypothetical protein